MFWMLLKCIVFNRDGVFETPALTRNDRNAQFSESSHITVGTVSSGRRLGLASCCIMRDSAWNCRVKLQICYLCGHYLKLDCKPFLGNIRVPYN